MLQRGHVSFKSVVGNHQLHDGHNPNQEEDDLRGCDCRRPQLRTDLPRITERCRIDRPQNPGPYQGRRRLANMEISEWIVLRD